jgi:hypothetical protein
MKTYNRFLLVLILLFTQFIFSQKKIIKNQQISKPKLNSIVKVESNRLSSDLVKLVNPTDQSIIKNNDIDFVWQYKNSNKTSISKLKILKVDSSLSLEENIKKNDVYLLEEITGKMNFQVKNISLNINYLWSIQIIEGENLVESKWWSFFPTNLEIQDEISCDKNLLQNNNFQFTRENWTINKGSPNFIKNKDGCEDPNYVELKYINKNSDVISQKLINGLKKGRHYKIKICIKNNFSEELTPLLKIIAFNGNLVNLNLSTNTSLVHSTGKIPFFKDWSQLETPVWTSNNNFENIGFYIENFEKDSDLKLLIDNICLVEVDKNECEEEIAIKFDNKGNYEIIDVKTNNIINSKKSKIIETSQDYKRGNVKDLYGSSNNTSTDLFYENLDLSSSCFSIGEYDPTKDFEEIDKKIDSTQFKNIIKDIKKKSEEILADVFLPEKFDPIIDVGPPDNDKQCNNYDKNLPFGGADIVYVHGLATAHIAEGLSPNQIHKKYKAVWPNDKREFYSGDYKEYADEYWKDHILSQITKSNGDLTNRYLTIAWPSDQRLGDGIHATFTQIADAINSGKGVVYDKNDPRGNRCFGNNIVIVSHSTGGLLVSSLLGIAELSNTNQNVQESFGKNLNNITDRVKIHIALAPALSGSKLASIAVVAPKILGELIGPSHNLATLAANNLISTYSNVIDNSVLIDLLPPVSQYYWGNTYFDKTKVQTVTLAGSTPGLPQGGAMAWAGKFLIYGYNDGVLSMDCTCASNQQWFLPSTYLINNPLKMIDFGNPFTTKAVGLSWDSRFNRLIPLSPVRISTCTPYVTPAGMLTPYKRGISGIKRWPNHHSMIQTTMTHFDPTDNIMTLYPNYNQSIVSNINNYEEVRVITNDYLYTSGLLSNNFKNIVNEHIRKKTIGFHFPAVRRVRRFPFVDVYWKYYEKTIWKRTYHLLQDYETKNGVDYMYQYILR